MTNDPSNARREVNAQTDARRFVVLALQLVPFVALAVWFPYFRASRSILAMILGGFVVHYWLPLRLKEPFWWILCGTGLFVAFEPVVVGVTVAMAVVLFAIVASPLTYKLRLAAITAAFGATLWAGNALRESINPTWNLFNVVSGLLWFRMPIYLNDVKHRKERPTIREALRYFFILPNFAFLNFPLVDFQTLRLSSYRRDAHVVAQEGIRWMALGVLQLLIYFSAYRGRMSLPPDAVLLGFLHPPAAGEHSIAAVVIRLTFVFTRYLRTSGSFWLCVGMLKLYGHDLPPIYNRFALSRSPLDFWRRTNIYVKDAMLKVVFLPIYFRFRKTNDLGAKLLGMTAVFVVSWLMHVWLWDAVYSNMKVSIWTAILFRWQEALYWVIFGIASLVEVLVEHAREKRTRAARIRPTPSTARGPTRWREAIATVLLPARTGMQVLATLFFVSAMWQLDSCPSLAAWFDALRWWE